ncbi:hypothetical protein GCM10011322_19410 [Salinarimonas ramus]|uniref:Uncharacterized protein n=1 Tax=Salinarimonas ramus TaxID=690164 RepID=A0A917Q6T6_9HYPH|nr:hypothetical protein GCM10011322_19410 [Salinarimonas ramus]
MPKFGGFDLSRNEEDRRPTDGALEPASQVIRIATASGSAVHEYEASFTIEFCFDPKTIQCFSRSPWEIQGSEKINHRLKLARIFGNAWSA